MNRDALRVFPNRNAQQCCLHAAATLVVMLFSTSAPAQCVPVWVAAATTGPTTRAYPGMAYDAGASLTLLYGGGRSSTFNRDLWQWNGTAWTLLNAGTTGGPGAREAVGMAFDVDRGVTVLFGGAGAAANDTWQWNGTAWSQVATSGPPLRGFTAMCYDVARQQCVLFGGWSNGFNYFNDTWTWNGTAWTQAGMGGSSPAQRGFHAAAYDVSRQRIVLFGGLLNSTGGSTYYGDTWEWNGAAWTQMNPPVSPPPRAYHSMTYDPVSHRVLLFGGFEFVAGTFDDVWSWDGATWVQLPYTTPWPLGRQAHGAAYDAQHAQVVVFGGSRNGSYRNDTWTLAPPVSALPGDVNNDNRIDGDDIAAFLALLDTSGPPTGAFCAADLNHSGTVDAADVPGIVSALLQ